MLDGIRYILYVFIPTLTIWVFAMWFITLWCMIFDIFYYVRYIIIIINLLISYHMHGLPCIWYACLCFISVLPVQSLPFILTSVSLVQSLPFILTSVPLVQSLPFILTSVSLVQSLPFILTSVPLVQSLPFILPSVLLVQSLPSELLGQLTDSPL